MFTDNDPVGWSNDRLITEWHNAKAAVLVATTQERNLRDLLTKRIFPTPPEKGTSRADIGFGKELKLTSKLSYTVDREALGLAKATLPADVLDSVIRYKPEVIESGLAVLDPRYRAAVAEFITSKPSAPSIEIVDAKKK